MSSDDTPIPVGTRVKIIGSPRRDEDGNYTRPFNTWAGFTAVVTPRPKRERDNKGSTYLTPDRARPDGAECDFWWPTSDLELLIEVSTVRKDYANLLEEVFGL
jgi:hypothetical protein